MPGSRAGGIKAAKTNKERHGEDFFRQIGSLGGRATGKKGFALNPELAKIAGSKGGKKSRRTGVSTGQGKKKEYYYNGDGSINTRKDSYSDMRVKPKAKPKKRTFIDRLLGR